MHTIFLYFYKNLYVYIMNSYKNKYLKYKNKYIDLKNNLFQSGGASNSCSKNDDIDNNFSKLKTFFNYNEEDSFLDEIKKQCKINSSAGPTIYSNWALNNNLLMGAIPKDCNDLQTIIDNGINLFISLREDDEIYQNCKNTNNDNKPIFWRFRIPDFNTRDVEDVKTLVDNIINYMENNKGKIMVHCLGGHGRTGTIICCVIAVFLLNNNLLTNNKNSIETKLKNLKNSKELEKEILELAEEIFKYAQFYVMLSLSTYRKTDSLLKKTPQNIKVPEISSQDLLVINVIKLYIENYLRNDFVNISLSKIEGRECGDIKNKNEEGNPIWKCAKICTN